MVDIPALRKVVDHALSLPTWADHAAHEEEAAVWDQTDWLRASAKRDADDSGVYFPGVYYHHASGCMITERCLVDSTGKKCGTAACIAGWTALLLAPDGTRVDGEVLTLPGGAQHRIEDWAQERLELDVLRAVDLFNGSNSHEDVMRITAEIITESEAAG